MDDDSMGLNKELEGMTVVSLEQAVAAPYCGLMLADAGARVIKVERPEGDFARGYDAWRQWAKCNFRLVESREGIDLLESKRPR
jgi:crotonobetainyl-CoA:carnitine CoA-transferase CaiB-like acyl-CoA transferase